MPLVTALSMIDTACFTSPAASAALSSTAVRAFLTAVRSEAIAARLRARCLIIFRFCFSADAILATGNSPKGSEWLTRLERRVKPLGDTVAARALGKLPGRARGRAPVDGRGLPPGG